jgi:hypoxanthine phosphoribosyltransferase
MKAFSSLVNTFRDMLSDKTRTKISQPEIDIYCDNLARIIQQKYQPSLVVAIETGGSVPGKLIARALNVPIVHVVIRRNINIVRRYSLDTIPLRWIMSLYHHYLFQTVKPVLSKDIGIDIFGKKI